MNACIACGVWKIASWMAFLLDDQIAHRVTAMRTNFSCGSESRRVNSQFFALSSVVATKLQPSSSLTRAHVHLDTVHSRMECRHESGEPQRPHVLVVDMWRCTLTSFVGRDCLDNLHKNIHTFEFWWNLRFPQSFPRPLFQVCAWGPCRTFQPCLSSSSPPASYRLAWLKTRHFSRVPNSRSLACSLYTVGCLRLPSQQTAWRWHLVVTYPM